MTDPTTPDPQPASGSMILEEIEYSIAGSWAVLLAHELGLFPLLHQRPRTTAEVGEALTLQPRAARALLTVCEAHGLLEKAGTAFRLTPFGAEYLVESSPRYFGGYLDLWIDNSAAFTYERVKEALLADSTLGYPERDAVDIFEVHQQEAARARAFTRSMHAVSMGPALAWPSRLDLSTHRVVLDIGGGSGANAIGAVTRWADLRAVILDLAPVCALAEEYVAAEGLQDRIDVAAGDMWAPGRFPDADLHVYGQIFHDWPLEKCGFLSRKSWDSLPSGGRIVVSDRLIDDGGAPAAIADYNITMVMWSEGEQHTDRQCADLLAETGFTEIQVLPSEGYWGVVTGRKP